MWSIIMKKIGLYIIATNNYNNLLDPLFIDLNEIYGKLSEYQVWINLATDQLQNPHNLSKIYKHLKFNIKAIPSYSFPDATLLRYKIINSFKNISTYDYCVYIDCDMKVHKNFLDSKIMDRYKITLVKHPVFNINASLKGFFYAITSRNILYQYFKSIKVQPFKLGTWENDKKSLAYVPYFKRKTYVHGAVWFGDPTSFSHLCGELEERVDIDRRNRIIAIWHDESHLNWYASNFKVNILESNYSWGKIYRHLRHLTPIISSIPTCERQAKLSN
jgi:hypothetical protein